MSQETTGLVIGLTIILLFVAIIVVCVQIKKARYRFVRRNSKRLEQMKKLNKAFVFLELKPIVYPIVVRLDSRRKFVSFDSEKRLKKLDEFIKQNKMLVERYINYSDRNESMLKEYFKQIKAISYGPTTLPSSFPFYININVFGKIEDELCNEMMLKPDINFGFDLKWSYTSPAGRNHYEDKRLFSRNEIKRRYKAIFEKYNAPDFEKCKSDYKTSETAQNFGTPNNTNGYNDVAFSKEEIAIKHIASSLDKPAYSKSQLEDILQKNNIPSEETYLWILINEAQLKKQKRVEIYVAKQFGTIDNAILHSANENGVITYNNYIKNIEYDYAIERLCKERRITPISNILFLKLDSAISFDGLTISDINYFLFLVKNLSTANEYISSKIVSESIKCPVTGKEYDDCFIYSLLKYSGFLNEVTSIKGLFTFKKSKDRFSFLLYMIGSKDSIDAFDMIYNIKETYGVEYNIYSILYDINKSGSDLYYNEETEKIYKNKDVFYKEIL